jgi:predicted helicase
MPSRAHYERPVGSGAVRRFPHATGPLQQSRLPGFSALADESRLAGAVKKQTPILVILGNPPYSGHSTNMGEWIRGLIEDYKKDVPELKRPAQAKWLQDDYVKFLRFAQWKIEQAGRGVVGMITNHSYLDNPTFRGMRQSLLRTFDEIYVLDLHGNALKKETCPDGGPDKNVFDIRQGVAIAFLVKRGGEGKTGAAVRHAERFGSREEKCDWLDAHDLKRTGWRKVAPSGRFFLFKPSDNRLRERYDTWPSLASIFSENGPPAPGIVTTQDEFAISWTAEEARRKVQTFLQTRSEREARTIWKLCSQSQWNYERAKTELAEGAWRDQVAPVLYRPFDVRWTVLDPNVAVHRRERVMRHMLAGENLALFAPRQHKADFGVWVSRTVGTHKTVAAYDINFCFPLYLYPEDTRGKEHPRPGRRWVAMMLFEEREVYRTKKPNLNPALIAALAASHGKPRTPEAIFYYIYAVLHAPLYRTKYAEFLRLDFPRIPCTVDAKLFGDLAALGEKLVGLHLLKSPELDPPACRFDGEGDSRIGRDRKAGLRYDRAGKRVYINAAQFFGPVSEPVWECRIGGYRVCEKWLKDRKGRRLELDDIRTYCRIVTAIGRTRDLQRRIDVLYAAAEEKVIAPLR